MKQILPNDICLPLPIINLLKDISGYYDTYQNILENFGNVGSSDLMRLNPKLRQNIQRQLNIQNELKHINERLITHINNTPLAVIEWDKNLKIIYWNSRAEEMFGWTSIEAIGQKINDLLKTHPDDLEAAKTNAYDLLNKVSEKNKAVSRNITKSGHSITCDWYNSALFDAKGEISSILSFASNISDAAIAQEQIIQNEANLNAIINNTHDTIFSVDKNYTITTINNSATTLTFSKTPAQQKVGSSFFIESHSCELQETWKKHFRRAFTGERFKTEILYTTYDKPTTLEVAFNPIIKNDEVVGVGCFGRDVTQEKRNAALLKSSETRFRYLIENSRDFLMLFNSSGETEYLSPSIERDFGFDMQTINQMSLYNLLHPEDLNAAVIKLQIALNKPGLPVNCTLRAKNKSEEYRYLEGTITNLLNKECAACVVVNFRDVTEQKLGQQKLIESEQKYRHLFELNPLPMWIIDPSDASYLYVNRAALKLYGCSRKEFCVVSSPQITAKKEWKTYIAQNKLNDGGFHNIGTWTHKKIDGTEIVVETHAGPIHFENKPAVLVIGNEVTEKYKAEQTLRENINRYNLVTRATNDAIRDWNMQTNELFWSEGYEKLFGHNHKNEKLNQMSWIRHIHPEDVRRVLAGIRSAVTDNESDYWEDEYRYIKSDGAHAHIYDRGFIIYDENKNAIRMVGAMQDITNRKKAEEYLYKSEANLRNILENTDTAYVLLDDHAQILSFNSRAKQISDREMASIKVGMNYITMLKPNRQADVRKALHKVIKIGQPVKYEVNYEQTDGSEIWLHVSMNPIFNLDKSVMGLSVAANDITERKNSEERLRKSEANLRTMFDNTEVSYILLDKDFKVLSFNQKAASGYAQELNVELKEGLNLVENLPIERKSTARKRYRAVLQGEKFEYETCFKQENGSEHWYSLNVFPVCDESKKILGIMIAMQNISERKNNELEKEKVTRDLIQRNKDLEQFAYIISHNLRSPVANILGLGSLIKDSQNLSKNEFEKCLDGLVISVNRLDDVITDLNFILQTRREIDDRKEVVSFNSILSNIVCSIDGQIKKQNVTISHQFSVEMMFTIKSYIHSIFYNLISNSIKYRDPTRSLNIQIGSEQKGQQLILKFKDNGLGIALDKHSDKVFGLYKKFHPQIEGKGMGLYMVKTQVEILGGKITVESAENEGTEFTITFKV